MLRRIRIAKLHRLVDAHTLDDEALRDALADDVDAGERKGLRCDFGFDGGEGGGGEGDGEEDDLGVDAVLGLCEEVGGDEGGDAGGVGDYLEEDGVG